MYKIIYFIKSLSIISLITIFSRVLGFIRDTMIARTFGANIDSDSFFIAFKIPNFFRRIFAEGAFSQAFIPILENFRYKKKYDIKNFISYTIGFLILALLIITIVGIFFSPWIVKITSSSSLCSKEKFNLTVRLLRIIFPYIIFISISSFISSILNSRNIFFVPAFVPIFLNISIIFFILFTKSFFFPRIILLSWSILVGGILQFLYQLPFLKRIDMFVFPKFTFFHRSIKLVLKNFFLYSTSIIINQFLSINNVILSSFLTPGSQSWIYYSDRIMEFFSGILGSSLNTLLLPLLSKMFRRREMKNISYLIDCSVRLCFILTIPGSILLLILSYPIIMTLFQYGHFSVFDACMTKNGLTMYALGLSSFILVKIFSQVFFAMQNIKIPLKISVITFIINQLINITFIKFIKHISFPLSISISSWCNTILLFLQLRKKNIFIPNFGWKYLFIRIISASVAMSIILLYLISKMKNWSGYNFIYRIINLLILVSTGITVYCFILFLLGLRFKNIFVIKKDG